MSRSQLVALLGGPNKHPRLSNRGLSDSYTKLTFRCLPVLSTDTGVGGPNRIE
jgi:hypothetical protein